MKSVITFLLPGLGQVFSGDARKGAIMFLSAIVTGPFTSGLGYFACGAWSVIDLQSRSASSSPRSATATLLSTTGVPASAAKGGGVQAAMPWLFKFSVLGLCAFLVLYSVRSGGALQSLEAFGVRLHFASLASEAGGANPGGPQAESTSGSGLDALSNALRSDPGGVPTSNPGSPNLPDDPKAGAVAPPSTASGPYPAASGASFYAGRWGSDLGATYQITDNGGLVQITEISRIFFVPVQTMTCKGQSTEEYISAECVVYDGQTGQLTLARNPVGGLSGVFTAYANGIQIPVNLSR